MFWKSLLYFIRALNFISIIIAISYFRVLNGCKNQSSSQPPPPPHNPTNSPPPQKKKMLNYYIVKKYNGGKTQCANIQKQIRLQKVSVLKTNVLNIPNIQVLLIKMFIPLTQTHTYMTVLYPSKILRVMTKLLFISTENSTLIII